MSKIREKKFYKPIKILKEELEKKQNGFPIVCLMLDEKYKEIGVKRNLKQNEKNKKKTHAEYILLQEIKDKEEIKLNKEITLYVTTPPCKPCLDKINNFIKVEKIQIKIYYFIDDVRKKWKKIILKQMKIKNVKLKK